MYDLSHRLPKLNDFGKAFKIAGFKFPKDDEDQIKVAPAGNFGSGIALWVDDDFSVSGSNGAGGLGDAYLKFVNVGRFLKLPTDFFSVRMGQFELDLPSPKREATT